MQPLHRLVLGISGRVRLAYNNEFPDDYIYQHVTPGTGNISTVDHLDTVLKRYTPPVNSNTRAQRAVRDRFREAVAAWRALSPAQRQDLDRQAAAERITGYNLWIRRWTQDHPLPVIPPSILAVHAIALCGLDTRKDTFEGQFMNQCMWNQLRRG